MSNYWVGTIKDACISVVDCVNKTAPTVEYETPYRMIRTSDIINGRLDYEALRFVEEDTFKKWSRRGALMSGDVVFTREAPVGRTALLEKADGLFLGQRTMCFRANRDICNPSYLAYYLQNPITVAKIAGLSFGSTVKHLRVGQCESIELRLPPLEQQRKVASILSSYDSLIENNRKQIKLLEEAAKRLYKEWFVDLQFPGHKTVNINPKTELPDGWSSTKLFDAVAFNRGVSYTSDTLSPNGGRRLINLGNLAPFGGFRDGYAKRYTGKYYEQHILSGGDLILGLTEQDEGLAGYAALVPYYLEGSLFSADLALLKPFQITTEYLYASLRYGNISRALSPFASGAKIKHLRPDHLRGVQIIVPDQSTTMSFTEQIREMLVKQDICRQEIHKLHEARDRLIPILISEKEGL